MSAPGTAASASRRPSATTSPNRTRTTYRVDARDVALLVVEPNFISG